MLIASLLASLVFAAAATVLLLLYLKSLKEIAHLRSELARFSEISDLEQYAARQTAQAEAAKTETEQTRGALAELKKNLETLRARVEKQKQQVNQYNKLLGNFKSAEQLKTHIAQQQQRVGQLHRTIGRFNDIAALNQHIAGQQAQVAALDARIKDMNEVLAGASTAGELHSRIQYQQNFLAELQGQVEQVEERLEMQEFGFYRPRFDFPSSSQYQQMLDQVRAHQKSMVKDNMAVAWDKQWVVEGSEAKGRKMMAEQTKLMLRAFNGECDAAVAKVKYNNATSLESRITRSCDQINKLGKTNCASITTTFRDLKLQELYLVHEHRVKQQEEKEEQRRIKEQMREEEKAQREIEKAERDAEAEEKAAETALMKARRELEKTMQGQREATAEARAQNEALAAQVAKLENELQDAIDRKAKAIARAQLTKSGHVYILSNIGSFGEDTYKIGMTRRLEPLERVKELGGASVPFGFDVHAMIYCENAPELENKLHQHFSDRRVNLVNLRREYFYVTLDEIIKAVGQHHGDITFVKTPEAAEYRQTLAQRQADQMPSTIPMNARREAPVRAGYAT